MMSSHSLERLKKSKTTLFRASIWMEPSLIFSKRLTHDVGSRWGKICKGIDPRFGVKIIKVFEKVGVRSKWIEKTKKTIIQDFNFECGHLAEIRAKDNFCTIVNIPYDLKDAHFEINTSHLRNAPSTLFKLYSTPLTNKRPLSNRRSYETLLHKQISSPKYTCTVGYPERGF